MTGTTNGLETFYGYEVRNGRIKIGGSWQLKSKFMYCKTCKRIKPKGDHEHH